MNMMFKPRPVQLTIWSTLNDSDALEILESRPVQLRIWSTRNDSDALEILESRPVQLRIWSTLNDSDALEILESGPVQLSKHQWSTMFRCCVTSDSSLVQLINFNTTAACLFRCNLVVSMSPLATINKWNAQRFHWNLVPCNLTEQVSKSRDTGTIPKNERKEKRTKF